MYNKASLKAEEFICHEEIEETLAYAEANKDNLALIDKITERAYSQRSISIAGLRERRENPGSI